MDSLSIYGAVVATLAAGWTIFREVTDRGSLSVQVVNMDMVQGGVVIGKDRLRFKVTNVGRRPIYLDRIGGRYKKGAPRSYFLIVTAQALPAKLEAGESFGDYSSDSTKYDFTSLRYLTAWDSTGKVYKAPKRHLKELLKG